MRVAAVVAAITFSLVNLSAASEAEAAVKRATNIPAQNLGSALEVLAKERSLQILYRSEVVGELKTAGAVGEFTAPETLARLLAGTGLTFKYLDDAAVTIIPVAGAKAATTLSDAEPAHTATGRNGTAEKSFWSRLRLAQADSADPASAGAVDSSGNEESSSRGVTEEVVVSAQKRGDERLQDVPVPVSVVDGKKLADSGQILLKDYYASVPGLNITPNIIAQQSLSIRGITTGAEGIPTVGVVIDDVIYGGSTHPGGANHTPDIDPGDLERLEVLRGPQGTLYGANSMGGLLKYVTRDPSTAGFSGRVEAGVSAIENGDGPGVMARASFNVPLSETWAMRGSAFKRKDAGYIDNPRIGRKGVNESRWDGVRLSAKWQPSDSFSLKLRALYQTIESDGSPEAHALPGVGDLEQSYSAIPLGADVRHQNYSAHVDYRIGNFDLSSITGYNILKAGELLDYTFGLGSMILANTGQPNVSLFGGDTFTKLSQELRVSAPVTDRIEWLAGLFYVKEHNKLHQSTDAANAAGEIVSNWHISDQSFDYEEVSVFTDLTFTISDRFDVQVGGRQSFTNVDTNLRVQQGVGIPVQLGVPSPRLVPAIETDAKTFTYLLTPRYRFSQGSMLYARFASGFRPGGSNTAPGAPSQFEPDETQTYEVGFKADFLDRTLSLDASVYYIDWQDIQVNTRNAQNFAYRTNGGRAKSQGIELSLTSRPADGLTLSGWVSYNDAVLTEDFPLPPPGIERPVYGLSGDRLPSTPRMSGHLSIDHTFPLGGSLTANVGAAVSYVGERESVFLGLAGGQPLQRYEFPEYTKADVHAGLRFGTWSTNLFVNNVTDERGLIAGGAGHFYAPARIYITPRTVGLNVVKEF